MSDTSLMIKKRYTIPYRLNGKSGFFIDLNHCIMDTLRPIYKKLFPMRPASKLKKMDAVEHIHDTLFTFSDTMNVNVIDVDLSHSILLILHQICDEYMQWKTLCSALDSEFTLLPSLHLPIPPSKRSTFKFVFDVNQRLHCEYICPKRDVKTCAICSRFYHASMEQCLFCTFFSFFDVEYAQIMYNDSKKKLDHLFVPSPNDIGKEFTLYHLVRHKGVYKIQFPKSISSNWHGKLHGYKGFSFTVSSQTLPLTLSSYEGIWIFCRMEKKSVDILQKHFLSSGSYVSYRSRGDITTVSLQCPYQSNRMLFPIKDVACMHYNGFDARSFIALFASKSKEDMLNLLKCPICQRHLSFPRIHRDFLLTTLLRTIEPTRTSIILEIAPNGTNYSILPILPIELLDDDDDDGIWRSELCLKPLTIHRKDIDIPCEHEIIEIDDVDPPLKRLKVDHNGTFKT